MDGVSLELGLLARRPDGIVTIRMQDLGRDVTRADAEAMIAALVRLDDQRPPLLILDGEKVTLSFEAQRAFAQTDSTCAVALVTARYLNQLISNTLIAIFPSLGAKYPMRWFSSQEPAEEWLRSVMAARTHGVGAAPS